MNRDLIITSTKGMSNEDWLRYRKKGIGASEVGAVLGLSEYTSSMEVFYEKIGEDIIYKADNIAMFNGRIYEDTIGQLWQYWDGDEMSLVKNYAIKRKVRKAQRVNGYVNNPKYPWLFVSLDFKINKNFYRGVQYGEGALEIKNMSGFEIDKWEFGIPASHLVQVQTQCLVCEFDYGELFIQQDGRSYSNHQFEKNKELCDQIIDITHDAWQNIERGRKIRTQIFHAKENFQMSKVDDLRAELMMLEPEPDASGGLEKFLKEKYRNGTAGEREGNITEYDWGQKHLTAKNIIKDQNLIILEAENHIKNSMREAECLNFGQDGKIYWANDVTGKRVFRNRLKLLEAK